MLKEICQISNYRDNSMATMKIKKKNDGAVEMSRVAGSVRGRQALSDERYCVDRGTVQRTVIENCSLTLDFEVSAVWTRRGSGNGAIRERSRIVKNRRGNRINGVELSTFRI